MNIWESVIQQHSWSDKKTVRVTARSFHKAMEVVGKVARKKFGRGTTFSFLSLTKTDWTIDA